MHTGKGTRQLSQNSADELFVVMQHAHTQDPTRKFVRDIKTAPEPVIVLMNDQQLQDIVRFTPFPLHLVSIDPTRGL